MSKRPKKAVKGFTHAKILPVSDLVHQYGLTKERCFWCREPITTNDGYYVIGFHPETPPERYHVDCIDGDVTEHFISRQEKRDVEEA